MGVLLVPAAIWFTLSVVPEFTFAGVAKKIGISSSAKPKAVTDKKTDQNVDGAMKVPRSASAVGINLGGIAFWDPSILTVDLFKMAGGADGEKAASSSWLTQCSWADTCGKIPQGGGTWNTLEQDKLILDEFGWIKQLPAQNDPNVGYRRVSALIPNGANQGMPAGKYIVTYDGDGVIEYGLGGTKNVTESRPGRDVVDAPDTKDRHELLITIAKTNPANYIRNIKVFQPGGFCNSSATKTVVKATDCTDGSYIPFEQYNASTSPFNPAYVDKLKGLRVLRFMDLGKTNDNPVSQWTERDKVKDAFWTSPVGIPYRAMVLLAKETNSDPWINVPTRASDEYIQKMAAVVKQTLGKNQVVYFEYTNEAWNGAFWITGQYLESKGKAKWNPNAKTGAELYDLRMNYYAYRSSQMCTMIKTVFGADANKVKCVYAGQAAVAWWLDNGLKCPFAAAELGKECGRFHDVIAIAPYFGGEIGGDAYKTKVATWLTQPDGGLASLFNELNTTSLAESVKWIQEDKKVADAWGLPLVAYEGGQHLVDYSQSNTALQDLFTKANHDPRMGELYTKYLNAWKDNGGQTFVTFSYVAGDSKWGYWGALQTIFETSSAKWDAVKNFSKIPCWWTNCQQ